MADIRSYMKEIEKRGEKREDYKEKIAKHKKISFLKVFLLVIALAGVAVFFAIKYKNQVYTDYDIIASVPREKVTGATDMRLGNSILTFSKDGAHCRDTRGNVNWNQTFEIQNVRLAVNGDTVAMGDYNGRAVYVANTERLLGEVNTTMPIRELAVSETGTVTAVLADSDVTWVNTYYNGGVIEGRTHMDDSGYPMAISLSPNGELLCVAYVYLDAGILKTDVAFYNFGVVGSNASDFLVSTWAYTDMLIPCVKFINDDTAFAVGDGQLIIYSGGYVPNPQAGYLYDREVQSVFYNDRYVGLVFFSDHSENKYQLNVYDTAKTDSQAKIFYFDMEYTDIFFEKDTFVIYNETECQVMTMGGIEKYRGGFLKPVQLMIPTGKDYRYILITEDSMDTIQLK